MNHLTTALTTFSTASAIVLGGVFFAPAPIVPAGPPTTAVPVELKERTGSLLKDGEVTTTTYRVAYRNGVAHAGSSVSTSTKATFIANLANGEYLIKTVVGRNTGLLSVQDIDGTNPVPSRSGCGNLYDCTWVVVSNNSWVMKGGSGQPHPVALFEFDRPTPVPTTTGVQIPTTKPSQVSLPGQSATTAPLAASAQTITFSVRDETNGLDNATPIEGAMTVVTYMNPASNVPYVIAGRTGADGRVSHTFPLLSYTVNVILPAGYEQSYTPDLGPHQADTADQNFYYLFLGKRPAAVTAEPRGQRDESPKQSPKVVTPAAPAAPAAPVVTDPPAVEQIPLTTTPAPVITQPAPVTTVPEPVVTVPETTPTPEPESRLGCDESDDPEVQALLRINDGAIRWIEDGEMITLYPEVGMDPVEVCEDTYHRFTELGIDIDFYTVR